MMALSLWDAGSTLIVAEEDSLPKVLIKLNTLVNEIDKNLSDRKDDKMLNKATENLDEILSILAKLPQYELGQEQKKYLPQLEQCGVKLWNITVLPNLGILPALLHARLRHTACNLVYLSSSKTKHEEGIKNQASIALKSARAWLDVGNAEMADSPLTIVKECVDKRMALLSQQKETGSGDADSQTYRNRKLDIDETHFKMLCYKIECLFGQGKHEEGVKLISQIKELLNCLPQQQHQQEVACLSVRCYNYGVNTFQKGDFTSSVSWLRESFELGKGNDTVGPVKQARTLRLLASVYLDWDSEAHWQKALNAVGLANAEHSHPAGLYLKIRILLVGNESNEVVKNGLEELLKHPEVSVDIAMNSIQLVREYKRLPLACDGLKKIKENFSSDCQMGQVMVLNFEILVQGNQVKEAQEQMEEIITAEHTNQSLDLSQKKRLHMIMWEQAFQATQRGDHSAALQWYNYSLSLYRNRDDNDTNLAKLHRNRAECFLELGKTQQAEEALSRAESCDPHSAFTFYVKYKMAMLNSQEEAAVLALQKMCECVMCSDDSSVTADIQVKHGLVCLAANLAMEKNQSRISIVALEGIISSSPDHQQVFASLRCLIRLTLETATETPRNRQTQDSIYGYLKSAHDKLIILNSDKSNTRQINIQSEATWFLKIAWNMGLECGENYVKIQQFFMICSKFQLLCPEDLSALNRHKTCFYMCSAASLQVAKSTSDQLTKREYLNQTVQYIRECQQVICKIEQVKQPFTDGVSDTTTPVMLLLYEFEAKALLRDPDLEKVLEKALAMPQCEAKTFESIAALCNEAPGDQSSLTMRAFKVAIKKQLQCSGPVNYVTCSKAFHSLIDLALQRGPNSDPSSRKEAWAYYLDVIELIENRAMGQYPDMEILWLMTKAWNCGIHLFNACNYPDSLQWCELAIKLLKHLGPLRNNYEKHMTDVYSEILVKVDGSKEVSSMEQ